MITGMCSLQLQRAIWSGSGPYDKVPNSPKPLQRCQFAQPPSFARLSSHTILVQTQWCASLWKQTPAFRPFASKAGLSLCVRGLSSPAPSKDILNILTKLATGGLTRLLKTSQESQVFRQCAPAIVLMVFAMWGLEPLFRIIRHTIFQKEDRKWKESQTRYLMTSYLRPILLWLGIILVCRSFDPLVLSTEASQAIKQRFLNFIRSLSTVLAFAYCTASLTQQVQKVMLDRQDSQDTRSVGAQFVGNAVYTAVWIAAVCLFMELLGFSTQKWLTAGGLGTVLLTLAGREIFTNFLSSVMIHATRPFVINEWIQTKIDGYEVSGTVEHVGWWSPTIVRGDDREAVHIPNHKFTVTVVRNLSQKSHWRIKTHFGISHLDVSKILSIVADMRKVLAKHPQVEQRRLHRRVFLENIDHENQALKVLVSCFVKTSHFEEYLRVKEVILLDLLKVISHHHARLATPIRSVQRVYDDMESRGAPFRDVNRSTEAQGRPYLLIEASATAGQRDSDQPKVTREPPSDGSEAAGSTSNESSYEVSVDTKGSAKPKQTQLEGLDSMGLNSKDITLLGAAFEKPPANIPEDLVSDTPQGEKIALRSSEGVSSRGEKLSSKTPDQPSQPKHEKGSSKLSDQPSQPKHEKVSSKLSDQLSQPKHEKVSSKLSDQPSQPKHEKVSSKLSDQPSQPKHEKRFLEQASQYVGKKAEKPTAKASDEIEKKAFEQKAGKLEKPTVKASDESLSLLTGEDQNTAVDFADVDQGKRKVDLDQRIDTRRPLAHGTSLHGSSSKQENERVTSASSKPPIEENLVLGVALDGPKRTLPLDNEIAPPSEEKELVTSGNGNPTNASKERRDGSQSLNTNPSEGREK